MREERREAHRSRTPRQAFYGISGHLVPPFLVPRHFPARGRDPALKPYGPMFCVRAFTLFTLHFQQSTSTLHFWHGLPHGSGIHIPFLIFTFHFQFPNSLISRCTFHFPHPTFRLSWFQKLQNRYRINNFHHFACFCKGLGLICLFKTRFHSFSQRLC